MGVAIGFSAEGKRLLCASEDRLEVRSLDGACLQAIELPLTEAACLSGDRLAMLEGAGPGKNLRLRTAASLKVDREIWGDFYAPLLSPDGHRLAIGGRSAGSPAVLVAELPELATWRPLAVSPDASACYPLAFSPDGELAAISFTETKRLDLVAVADGKVVRSIELPDAFAASAAFSPDGDRLAVRTGSHGLYLFPVRPVVALPTPREPVVEVGPTR
jgi:hypothetical protein